MSVQQQLNQLLTQSMYGGGLVGHAISKTEWAEAKKGEKQKQREIRGLEKRIAQYEEGPFAEYDKDLTEEAITSHEHALGAIPAEMAERQKENIGRLIQLDPSRAKELELPYEEISYVADARRKGYEITRKGLADEALTKELEELYGEMENRSKQLARRKKMLEEKKKGGAK